jgi:hypothetical protein
MIKFFIVSFLMVLIPAAFGQTNPVPPVSTPSPTVAINLTWAQLGIPILVPLVIALLKWLMPKIPPVFIPVLAALLGALADYCMTGSGKYGAYLGAAGVGLREIVDQIRKLGNGDLAKATSGLLLFASLLVPLPLLMGCGTLDKSGIYQGDTVLYNAELATTEGKDMLHTFVKWEYDNRAFLRQWPQIKEAADDVRLHAKSWVASAIALRNAYVANPTQDTRSALEASVIVIRAALNQATVYMATPINGTLKPSQPATSVGK